MKIKTKIQHPIYHDMHYGAPDGCVSHKKLAIGSFRDSDEPDASAVINLIFPESIRTNKILQYLGIHDDAHTYIYSYDSCTLGVVRFAVEPATETTSLAEKIAAEMTMTIVTGEAPAYILDPFLERYGDYGFELAEAWCKAQLGSIENKENSNDL